MFKLKCKYQNVDKIKVNTQNGIEMITKPLEATIGTKRTHPKTQADILKLRIIREKFTVKNKTRVKSKKLRKVKRNAEFILKEHSYTFNSSNKKRINPSIITEVITVEDDQGEVDITLNYGDVSSFSTDAGKVREDEIAIKPHLEPKLTELLVKEQQSSEVELQEHFLEESSLCRANSVEEDVALFNKYLNTEPYGCLLDLEDRYSLVTCTKNNVASKTDRKIKFPKNDVKNVLKTEKETNSNKGVEVLDKTGEVTNKEQSKQIKAKQINNQLKKIKQANMNNKKNQTISSTNIESDARKINFKKRVPTETSFEKVGDGITKPKDDLNRLRSNPTKNLPSTDPEMYLAEDIEGENLQHVICEDDQTYMPTSFHEAAKSISSANEGFSSITTNPIKNLSDTSSKIPLEDTTTKDLQVVTSKFDVKPDPLEIDSSTSIDPFAISNQESHLTPLELNPYPSRNLLKPEPVDVVHQLPSTNNGKTFPDIKIKPELMDLSSLNEKKFRKKRLMGEVIGLLGYRRFKDSVPGENGTEYEIVMKYEPVELIYVLDDIEEVQIEELPFTLNSKSYKEEIEDQNFEDTIPITVSEEAESKENTRCVEFGHSCMLDPLSFTDSLNEYPTTAVSDVNKNKEELEDLKSNFEARRNIPNLINDLPLIYNNKMISSDDLKLLPVLEEHIRNTEEAPMETKRELEESLVKLEPKSSKGVNLQLNDTIMKLKEVSEYGLSRSKRKQSHLLINNGEEDFAFTIEAPTTDIQVNPFAISAVTTATNRSNIQSVKNNLANSTSRKERSSKSGKNFKSSARTKIKEIGHKSKPVSLNFGERVSSVLKVAEAISKKVQNNSNSLKMKGLYLASKVAEGVSKKINVGPNSRSLKRKELLKKYSTDKLKLGVEKEAIPMKPNTKIKKVNVFPNSGSLKGLHKKDSTPTVEKETVPVKTGPVPKENLHLGVQFGETSKMVDCSPNSKKFKGASYSLQEEHSYGLRFYPIPITDIDSSTVKKRKSRKRKQNKGFVKSGDSSEKTPPQENEGKQVNVTKKKKCKDKRQNGTSKEMKMQNKSLIPKQGFLTINPSIVNTQQMNNVIREEKEETVAKDSTTVNAKQMKNAEEDEGRVEIETENKTQTYEDFEKIDVDVMKNVIAQKIKDITEEAHEDLSDKLKHSKSKSFKKKTEVPKSERLPFFKIFSCSLCNYTSRYEALVEYHQECTHLTPQRVTHYSIKKKVIHRRGKQATQAPTSTSGTASVPDAAVLNKFKVFTYDSPGKNCIN